MKSRWREHEFILVSILAAISIGGDLWYATDLAPKAENYYINTLLPQVLSKLLLYGCYCWISRFTIPRLVLPTKEGALTKRIIWSIMQFVVVAYIFAIGINIATYFARPHLVNYGGFQLLALLGYNDHPLTDPFKGFARALALVVIYLTYACIREVIIYLIEKPGERSAYRVLIANQFTLFPLILFTIPAFLSAFNLMHEEHFNENYYAYAPPAYFMHLSNVYWLFPLKGEKSFFNYRIIIRLLISGFICTLPVITSLRYHPGKEGFFLVIWAICVFIVTPLSWLYYTQRKDKILQLRGAQKALIQSTTDLQFLRSQINPHFLFNALNTLYGTALREGSKRTAEGIQKLGDMMRFMLHENNQDFIAMTKEIEYLENFISLQKLRIQSSPGIVIENYINEKHCNHRIAPMLLIPFIENAFKHGISLTEKSWIKIMLTCDEKNIRFEVRNSIHTFRNNDPEREKSGIGLMNVAERLKLIYPGRHEFIAIQSGNEFVAQLSIRP